MNEEVRALKIITNNRSDDQIETLQRYCSIRGGGSAPPQIARLSPVCRHLHGRVSWPSARGQASRAGPGQLSHTENWGFPTQTLDSGWYEMGMLAQVRQNA